MRSWLDETCNLAGMIAEAKIELRKKYYDGNMVREAVMSVTDDYNTIMKLLKAFADQPPLTDIIEVVRCKDCRYRYVDGENVRYNVCGLNHNKVQSDDWFCADGERRGDGTD